MARPKSVKRPRRKSVRTPASLKSVKTSARPISVKALIEAIADPSIPLKELRPLVKLDASRSDPFRPAVIADPDALGIRGITAYSPTAGSISGAFARRRQEEYRRKINVGYASLKFVAEGDSWFQYPLILETVIDCLNKKYAISDLSAAGDTLANMKLGIQNIENLIKQENSDGFLLSGGGNDILADGKLAYVLRFHRPGFTKPIDYIITWRLNSILNGVLNDYKYFFDYLTLKFASLKIFCHGYDWMIPRWSGIYLWPTMRVNKEIPEIPKSLMPGIIAMIVDWFNDKLELLASDPKYGGRVIYVNCRNRVGANTGKWFDEIHPKNPGFEKVAAKFDDEIIKAFA